MLRMPAGCGVHAHMHMHMHTCTHAHTLLPASQMPDPSTSRRFPSGYASSQAAAASSAGGSIQNMHNLPASPAQRQLPATARQAPQGFEMGTSAQVCVLYICYWVCAVYLCVSVCVSVCVFVWVCFVYLRLGVCVRECVCFCLGVCCIFACECVCEFGCVLYICVWVCVVCLSYHCALSSPGVLNGEFLHRCVRMCIWVCWV